MHIQAYQEPVLLLSVVLSFISPVHYMQLVKRWAVASHLCVQCLLYVLLTLYLLLPFINDAHHSVNVLKLILAFPEYLSILSHLQYNKCTQSFATALFFAIIFFALRVHVAYLFFALPFDFFANAVHVVSSIFGRRLHKLVKIPTTPVRKTLNDNTQIFNNILEMLRNILIIS